jgi:hypothetical protein
MSCCCRRSRCWCFGAPTLGPRREHRLLLPAANTTPHPSSPTHLQTPSRSHVLVGAKRTSSGDAFSFFRRCCSCSQAADSCRQCTRQIRPMRPIKTGEKSCTREHAMASSYRIRRCGRLKSPLSTSVVGSCT